MTSSYEYGLCPRKNKRNYCYIAAIAVLYVCTEHLPTDTSVLGVYFVQGISVT